MADALAHPAVTRPATPRAFGVIGPETVTLSMSDGATLVADVYRPDGPGRFPVLLMRQPYGRRIASTVVFAHPAWYASRGFIVVVQDVRGCGDSAGVFRVLENEADDGAETLAWAADLRGATGQVAAYGFSYQAMTTLLAFAGARKAGAKRPDAIIAAMGAWSVRDHWAYEGDCFLLASSIGWACQMGAEQARRTGDHEAFLELASAARGAPWMGAWPAKPDVLARLSRYAPHYERWRADEPDAFANPSPDVALRGDALDAPALFVGGWFDSMLDGTLAMHQAFAAKNSDARLIVGPWIHSPWGRAQGDIDLGVEASSDIDGDAIRFLDLHLRGEGSPSPPVKLFDVGEKRWRTFNAFPESATRNLHLASGGRAATTTKDGALRDAPMQASEDWLVHDPWRPAPIIGGHLGTPQGMRDRAALDDRADVAVYTSDELAAPLQIAGRVAADLHIACDMPSHDVHCTLSILPPQDSRALTLTSGHLRVADSWAPGARRVSMRAACATVPRGARLRLSIQAAAFPAFAVNPGTGARAQDAHAMDARVTTLRVAHGAARPSRLLLPVHA